MLSLSALAYILLQSMVLPALPEIGKALNTSQSTVAWVLTAYLISASVATPVLGRLGDMHGKKRVLLFVLVALIVGSVLAALTSSVAVMLTARVIQGAGGAIFPLAFSIIRDEFPRERVAGAIGLISALIGVGAGVAIVIAGPIVDNLSIHWLFWIPAAMTAVALVATIFWVPESPIKAPGHIDPFAVLTLSGWLVCLLLGVSEGGEWGWTSARVIGLFVAAVLLFVAWLWIETRAEQPLVDVRMMRIPTVWWTNISAMLFGFGMYSVMIVVPAFLQTGSSAGYGFGASITQSGLAILPLSAAMLVSGILTGAFSTRFGSKVPLVVGSVFSAAGDAVPRGRARKRVELLRRDGARRVRDRLRVRGDVEPRRRGGPGDADRCGHRHERERADDRRRDRQPGRRVDHRRDGGGSRVAEGVRLRALVHRPRASLSRSRASRRCSSRRARTARRRPMGTSSTPWRSTRA